MPQIVALGSRVALVALHCANIVSIPEIQSDLVEILYLVVFLIDLMR